MARYYVTATWEDWPEGGSYGTIVTADTKEGAQLLCLREMALLRAEDLVESWTSDAGPDVDIDAMIKEQADVYQQGLAGEWHIVDCFDLDWFIHYHSE